MSSIHNEQTKQTIIQKCKVSLVVAFQEGCVKQPVELTKYELAYIIAKLRGEI